MYKSFYTCFVDWDLYRRQIEYFFSMSGLLLNWRTWSAGPLFVEGDLCHQCGAAVTILHRKCVQSKLPFPCLIQCRIKAYMDGSDRVFTLSRQSRLRVDWMCPSCVTALLEIAYLPCNSSGLKHIPTNWALLLPAGLYPASLEILYENNLFAELFQCLVFWAVTKVLHTMVPWIKDFIVLNWILFSWLVATRGAEQRRGRFAWWSIYFQCRM